MPANPKQPAFQDEIPDNYCFGCGPLNPDGLAIRSFWEGDESVCRWRPHPEHMAGPQDILNGGIIATIIDCHCVCTAIADAYRREGRAVGAAPQLWYATAKLEVGYLRPTPLDAPVTLRARITEVGNKKTLLRCTLYSAGYAAADPAAEENLACAEATVLAVRVPPEWRHGLPRR